MTPKLRRMMGKHKSGVNVGAVSGRKTYEPRDEDLRRELHEIRSDTAYRTGTYKERKKGVDLDERAESIWKEVAYDDTEERRLSRYVVHSWWPRLMAHLQRQNVVFVPRRKDNWQYYELRSKLRAIFGTREYPYLPNGSLAQLTRIKTHNPGEADGNQS